MAQSNQAALNSTPNCKLLVPNCKLCRIKRAPLQVTDSSGFILRVCPNCLWDACEALKAAGARDLRVTAPEQPVLEAWR